MNKIDWLLMGGVALAGIFFAIVWWPRKRGPNANDDRKGRGPFR